MVIKEMNGEHAADWFDFFDTRAFADHKDWQGCYCTAFFTPRLENYSGTSKRRKDYAHWLVAQGLMRGYLAYESGEVVGWCNVNAKQVFPGLAPLMTNEDRVLAIACFIVQKEYRGRGIAQKLLDRIIDDAKKANRRIIEAYPRPKATTAFGNWHGPYALYEKNGFRPETLRGQPVMRRYL